MPILQSIKVLIQLTRELVIEVDNERLRRPIMGGEEREKTKKDRQRRTIKKSMDSIKLIRTQGDCRSAKLSTYPGRVKGAGETNRCATISSTASSER